MSFQRYFVMDQIHKLKFPQKITNQAQVLDAVNTLNVIVKYYQDHYYEFSGEWHDVTLAFLTRKGKQIERFNHGRKYKICA